MLLRLLRACLCLVLSGCATTPTAPARAPASPEVPACTPGELLFAPSYLPLDLVPTPDGRSLLVVDRGFLALRDVSTLKVQRYLLPQVDGWVSASLSADGRTVTAQTFDGQRYAFDTTTWKAERLQDARVLKHDREKADFALMAPSENMQPLIEEALPQLTDELREPALIQELTEKKIFPFAVALEASRQQLLIGETSGALTLLDLDGQRILKRVPCEACSPYVALSADAEGFLGVTVEGQLRVLDRELKVVREVSFLPPAQAKDGKPHPRLVKRVVRVGDGSRIAWLARDHEMGLFELGTGTHVLRLPALGLGGTAMAALLDARRLALLSEGTLRVWDMPEQRVLVEKQGPYTSAVRLDADRLLATRGDGTAELVSASSGEVQRSFCATLRSCERDRAALERLRQRAEQAQGEEAESLYAELGLFQVPVQVELLVSPDRRTLVTLSYPVRTGRGGPVLPGSLGTWRLPGLEPLGMRPLTRDEVEGEVRFGADGVLYTGREPLSVAGLPTPAAKEESGRGLEAPGEENVRVYSGGGLTIRVEPAGRQEDFYDAVVLLGPGERTLGVLSFITVEARRWPLRRETFADVLPSGERFLIASVAREEGTPFGSFRLPSGPAQVWCSPKETPLPPFPEAPPLPTVMEVDGLTEVSLADVPLHYEAIAATEDGSAYLLARGQPEPYAAPSGPATLWRLTPGSPEAERLEPPPASDEWYRLGTAPDDGSLWALGKGALAHREADGRWTMHTLPGARDGRLTGFLALPGGRAVVLRQYSDAQQPQQLRLQLVIAGPGPALQVTEHLGGGEPMPLVPLPDGFLFLGTRASRYAVSGAPAPVLVPGFRFRDGKRLEKDALLAQVRSLQPWQVWLRQGRVLLLAERASPTVSWLELDARTGRVLKEQEPSTLPQTIVGVPDARSASNRQGQELPQWLDHEGTVLELPGRYTPTWLRLGYDIEETASTPKGTWLRLKGDVLLFWNGTRLSAYFHPGTRAHGIRYAE
ncbi:hypothetical protein NR798_03320 [Archangium gephyra]|uniref:hypothetical protein n=1 Tax=Archangium gephyra TaxID=48 RepID=UPI0035D4D6DF